MRPEDPSLRAWFRVLRSQAGGRWGLVATASLAVSLAVKKGTITAVVVIAGTLLAVLPISYLLYRNGRLRVPTG